MNVCEKCRKANNVQAVTCWNCGSRLVEVQAFRWVRAVDRVPECGMSKDPNKGWLAMMAGRKYPAIVTAHPANWNKRGLEDGLAPKGHCSPQMWDGPKVLFWAEIPEPPKGTSDE